jgi:ceramide glucosyltransferase
VALLAGQWQIAAGTMALRMIAGIWIGAGILRDREVLKNCWMIPARDLFGFAVWAAGLVGNRVQWRDRILQLERDGRIHEETPAHVLAGRAAGAGGSRL